MDAKLKKRVLDACRSQQSQGIVPRRHTWGVYKDESGRWAARDRIADMPQPTKCACALGCLILEEQPKVSTADVYHALKVQLKATEDEIDSFTRGFDGAQFAPKWDLDWFMAGYDVALELFGPELAA
jgi:hypothetical protein